MDGAKRGHNAAGSSGDARRRLPLRRRLRRDDCFRQHVVGRSFNVCASAIFCAGGALVCPIFIGRRACDAVRRVLWCRVIYMRCRREAGVRSCQRSAVVCCSVSLWSCRVLRASSYSLSPFASASYTILTPISILCSISNKSARAKRHSMS